jgi:Arc/MetJ-type ribon-helix-helix transcriptional regulator
MTRIQIALRLPEEVIAQLDDFWKSSRYPSRNAAIVAAVNDFLTTDPHRLTALAAERIEARRVELLGALADQVRSELLVELRSSILAELRAGGAS